MITTTVIPPLAQYSILLIPPTLLASSSLQPPKLPLILTWDPFLGLRTTIPIITQPPTLIPFFRIITNLTTRSHLYLLLLLLPQSTNRLGSLGPVLFLHTIILQMFANASQLWLLLLLLTTFSSPLLAVSQQPPSSPLTHLPHATLPSMA